MRPFVIAICLLAAACGGDGLTSPASPTSTSPAATGAAPQPLPAEPAQMQVAAAAARAVPFKGTLEGIGDPPEFEPPPSTFFSAHLTAGGTATHLGRFTMEFSHRVNLADLTGTGTATFTAANGDTLTTTAVGTATPAGSPTAYTVTETHTITGGTGRFAGATGTFVITRAVDFADPYTSGSIDGELNMH